MITEYTKEYQKNRKKYIKNIPSERSTGIFSICGPKQKIYVFHKRFRSLRKNAKKFFFGMPLHQMDIDGFKSNLFLLLYGPLEPMVINFTCDFSLVNIPLPMGALQWKCSPLAPCKTAKIHRNEGTPGP